MKDHFSEIFVLSKKVLFDIKIFKPKKNKINSRIAYQLIRESKWLIFGFDRFNTALRNFFDKFIQWSSR